MRRQERVAAATSPAARLEASYDYVRGVIAEVERTDAMRAERLREEAAQALMTLGRRAGRL